MDRRPDVWMSSLGLMLLIAIFATARAHADAPAPCTIRLAVELAPDVPAPRDPGFLSSLVGNHVGYQLIWVRQDGSFTSILDLNGPGPDDRCQSVVEAMRADGRVFSVRPYVEDIQSVVLVGLDTPAYVEPAFHVSRTGLGAFFWAARHPAHAWTIVTPVRQDSPALAVARRRAQCLAIHDSTHDTTDCP